MKFTERFTIDVDLEEARKRFVNRVYNRAYLSFFLDLGENERFRIHKEIISALGDKYQFGKNLSDEIGDDYHRNLQALEVLYNSVNRRYHDKANNLIISLLEESEVDLGVRWENGRFIKSGAKILDDKLVNDVLYWLRDNKYISVMKPFEKGLEHFLHSDKRPEILSDVITDMYEALEALTKIVTKRPNKELSANRELFVSKVKASSAYKRILDEYITYANEFRHAIEEGKTKPVLNSREVESFIYLTGVFIRLTM
ncbi:MAG: hypothetical protein HQ551_13280 [Desulfobacteraceae bacterium]|nr:hypothetical protein [Desulfobacteraceae bacterium]